MIHISCKWHNTTQKTWTYEKFEKKLKKSGVAGTRTHDRGSVPLWHPLLYHCATGLTQWKLVKIKIIYHVGGILCCMVLCRVVLCCVMSCCVMSCCVVWCCVVSIGQSSYRRCSMLCLQFTLTYYIFLIRLYLISDIFR